MSRKKKIFKITLVAIVLATVLLAIVGLFLISKDGRIKDGSEIKLGNQNISVEIARTDAEQERGLGGRSAIGINNGMLFVFNEPTVPGFWMKDMKFPIDIVWISNDRIIGVVENVDPQIGVPESKLTIYTPPSLVDSVIELRAGTFNLLNARVGDEVITSRFLDSIKRPV